MNIRVDERDFEWGVVDGYVERYGLSKDDVSDNHYWVRFIGGYVCISRGGCLYRACFYDQMYSVSGVFFNEDDLGRLMCRIVSYLVANRLG